MSDGRAAALVVAAAVLWGTAGATQELALPGAAPAAVAAARSLVGGGLLVVWALTSGRGAATLGATLRTGGLGLLVVTAAMLVFQLGYLEGIRRAGVAVGTLTAIGSAPVWAAVLAAFRRRRGRQPGPAVSRRWLVATVLAVAGLVVLVAPGSGTTVAVGGVLAALVAGAGYATAATATAELVGRGVDRVGLVAVVFLACGVLLAPTLGQLGPLDVAAIAGTFWLGVATIAAAYVLFASGLRGVDAPTATTLTLAEPLTATLLAVVVVGESLGLGGLVGAGAIAAGVLLAGRPPRAPVARTGPGGR